MDNAIRLVKAYKSLFRKAMHTCLSIDKETTLTS